MAAAGEVFTNAQGRTDARLRVIFNNGTESNMLMRSLQRANRDLVHKIGVTNMSVEQHVAGARLQPKGRIQKDLRVMRVVCRHWDYAA